MPNRPKPIELSPLARANPLCAARAAWLQKDTLAERRPACDAVVKVQSGGNGLNVGREFRSRRTGVYLYRRGLRPPLFPWPIFGCRAIGEVCRFTSLREACRAPAWRRQFLYARPPPSSCGLANRLIDASLHHLTLPRERGRVRGALRVVVPRHAACHRPPRAGGNAGRSGRAGNPRAPIRKLGPIRSCKGRCRSAGGPSQRDEPAIATHAARPANRPPARP